MFPDETGQQSPDQAPVPKRAQGRPPKVATGDKKESMEKQIVTHAKFLFRQKGFSSISISEIVNAVGITKPTLYYYFKDKEHLYTAVLVNLLERGKHFIEMGIQGKAALKDQLELLTEGYFRNSLTSLIGMMKDSMEHLNEEGRQQVQIAYRNNILEPLRQIFDAAVESGEIAQTDTTSLAQTFISILDGLNVQHNVMFGRNYDFKQKSTEAVNVLMNSMMLKPA